MKTQFVRAVRKVDDLTVRTGAWSWSEQNQRPSWDTLKKANVWNVPEYADLRQQLGRARVQWIVTESGDSVVSITPSQVDPFQINTS